jgi:hypothetical protein
MLTEIRMRSVRSFMGERCVRILVSEILKDRDETLG